VAETKIKLTGEQEALAKQLAEARQARTRCDAKPEALVSDEATAFAVQQAAVSAYPSKRIGYKIGATSPAAQAMIGCDGPFFAPMFERDVFSPDATLPRSDTWLAVECEFAFRMSATPASALHTDLAESIESCHPALEVIGRRTEGEGLSKLISSICDFGLNAAFCAGEAIKGWQVLDLGEAEVVGLVDGTETNRGQGSAVLGNPLNALGWLSEKLAEAGTPLAAGDWISTGTCLGIIPATPGATITGDYGELGRVSLTFAH